MMNQNYYDIYRKYYDCFKSSFSALSNIVGLSASSYKQYCTEIRNDSLYRYLLLCYSDYTKSYYSNWDPVRTIDFYYSLIRHIKPKLVLETGVAYGFSSMIILSALYKNATGMLISVDYPLDDIMKRQKIPGWLVPDEYRARWKLFIGKSEYYLPKILGKYSSVDIFIHDSLHEYDHMIWEYETVWPKLSPGGILLSDDVLMNEAFYDFTKMMTSASCVLLGRYGLVRKNNS